MLLDATQLGLQPNHFPGVEPVQMVVRMPSVAIAAGAHPVEVLMQDRYLRLDAVDLDGRILQTFTAQRQQRVNLTETSTNKSFSHRDKDPSPGSFQNINQPILGNRRQRVHLKNKSLAIFQINPEKSFRIPIKILRNPAGTTGSPKTHLKIPNHPKKFKQGSHKSVVLCYNRISFTPFVPENP